MTSWVQVPRASKCASVRVLLIFGRTRFRNVRSARRSGLVRSSLPLAFLMSGLPGTVPALAQAPVSIFGDAAPNNPVEADPNAVTLGVKFWIFSETSGCYPPSY